MKRTTGFKDKDFKVKLGSIVDSDTRIYYAQNRFSYLVTPFRFQPYDSISNFGLTAYLRPISSFFFPVSD